MRKANVPPERYTEFNLWDCLNDEEQCVLRNKFKRFKPPAERLPPLESQEEIDKIMKSNKEVSK